MAWAKPNSPLWHLDTGLFWHDNATNAERSEDLLTALQWRTELGTAVARTFGGGHRLQASVAARSEVWPRFEGLNLISPGVAVTWEFKPGLGPHRPVFTAEIEGEWAVADENERSGRGGAGRLQVRQRVGVAWLLIGGHEWRRFDARGRAFDRTGRKWSGRVEWTPVQDWIVAAEVHERVGDVVSYSRPPRPDLEASGKPITFVDTFEQDVPWIAYYFRARTRSGAVEVQRMLGHTALTLRHEYHNTLHAGPGYKNHLTALRFSTTF